MIKRISIRVITSSIFIVICGILATLISIDSYFKNRIDLQYARLEKSAEYISKTLILLNSAQNAFTNYYQYKYAYDYEQYQKNMITAQENIASVKKLTDAQDDILLFTRIFLQVTEGLMQHIDDTFLSDSKGNNDYKNLNRVRDSFSLLKSIYNQLTLSYMNYSNSQHEIIHQNYQRFKNTQLTVLILLIFLPICIFVYFMYERINYEKSLRLQIIENEKQRKMLIESQFRVLQTQMDPHFLFNTLNLIMRVIQTGENKKAVRLIKAMSDILRSNLESKTLVIPLEKEIENIKSYIYIVRERLEGRAVIELDICDMHEPLFIPPFSIQPFIENAIKHGLSRTVKKGKISVAFTDTDAALLITIEDNGKGAEQAFFDVLLQQKERQEKGIGIYNIYQRLIMCFSNPDVLHIESSPGKGTRVQISVFKNQRLSTTPFILPKEE